MAAATVSRTTPSTFLVPAKKAKKDIELVRFYRVLTPTFALIRMFMAKVAHRMDMGSHEFSVSFEFQEMKRIVFPRFQLTGFNSWSAEKRKEKTTFMRKWADAYPAGRLTRANVRSFQELREKAKAVDALFRAGMNAFVADNTDLLLERDHLQLKACRGIGFLEEDCRTMQWYWGFVKNNPALHEEQEKEFEFLRTHLFSQNPDSLDEFAPLNEKAVKAILLAKALVVSGFSAEKMVLYDYLLLRWEMTGEAYFWKACADYRLPLPETGLSEYQAYFLVQLLGIPYAGQPFNAQFLPHIDKNLKDLSPQTFVDFLVQRAQEEIVEYGALARAHQAVQINLANDQPD